jgi:hypothetical protein
MCKVRPRIREGMKSEVWILPHEYSCGGYYLAERWETGILRGITYSDNLNFWLVSGQTGVLSQEQAKHAMDYRRSLGEEIHEVWADSLPEGSRWLNARWVRD